MLVIDILRTKSLSLPLPAHARMSGPFGNRGSNESREQTIANGESLFLS